MRSRGCRMRGYGGICASCWAAMIRRLAHCCRSRCSKALTHSSPPTRRWRRLSGSLLHPDLVTALDGLGGRSRVSLSAQPQAVPSPGGSLAAPCGPRTAIGAGDLGNRLRENGMLPLPDPERSGCPGAWATRVARRGAGDHALSPQCADREPARATLGLDEAIRRKASLLPIQRRPAAQLPRNPSAAARRSRSSIGRNCAPVRRRCSSPTSRCSNTCWSAPRTSRSSTHPEAS